jgi:hypothetical protein
VTTKWSSRSNRSNNAATRLVAGRVAESVGSQTKAIGGAASGMLSTTRLAATSDRSAEQDVITTDAPKAAEQATPSPCRR